MAENKKSFVLYCDIIHMVNKLPNGDAGLLFKHILSYVNDEKPTTDNILIEIAFEHIKQQFKRDLVKYKSVCDRNKLNGLKGGRPINNPKEPKKPTGLINNPKEPKKPDNDNDNDNDNDIKIKNGFNLSFIEPIYEFQFKRWVNYKKEIKDQFKTQKGIEQAYKNLKKISNSDITIMTEIIDNSIGNEYKGLFPLKKNLDNVNVKPYVYKTKIS